jgi:hypothetical protein
VTSARTQHLAFVIGAVLLGVALVALRGYPWLTSDQGVFLSVAARMLDGDVLYADVIDNKDPLFFYTYAAALFAGGYRAPFALDAVWFAVATGSMALLLRELRAPPSAVLCAAAVYPLALAASWYRPGLSMLAALALCPLAAWLWVRGSYALSGVTVAVVILFKLNLGLLVVAPIAVFWAIREPPAASRRPQLVRALVGFASTLAIAAAVLAAQGALGDYVGVVGNNLHYSGARSSGFLGGVEGHLEVIRTTFTSAGRWQAPLAVLFVALLVAAVVVVVRRFGRRDAALGIVALATLAAGLVTLALTAIWSHHLQLLAYPATLGAAALVTFAVRYRGWLGIAAAISFAGFALWSTAKLETDGISTRAWTDPPFKVPSTELEQARVRYFPRAENVTYMVFGSNSENAHAVFIDDAFDLSCRWFHLYTFNRPELFDETMDCAIEEAPMLVLVTLGFEGSDDSSEWASFVARARGLLKRDYELVGTAYPGFEVWKRVEEAS